MDIKTFQQKILTYYRINKRDLPWRKTTDPYKILLSEVMLQQTQVDRGLVYFNKWTKKWPTIEKLAKAKRTTVLKMWMGLGYNNRAMNLHKTANIIVKKYNGNILKAIENFKELPGIGPYTAAAVHIFSQNKDLVTVDTNIRRIFIHEFKLSEKVSDKKLWELAEKCLPYGKSRDWHNALMDYGATLLTSRRTGIKPKTQQSKFEGSDRQIRAKILRSLLEQKKLTEDQLLKQHHVSQKRFRKIIEKMIDEHLVKKRLEYYSLA